jgi:hypothetical protein
LLLLSKVVLTVYLTVPMALFLVSKALRGDLRYWVPRSGLRIAVFSRVTAKIFVDVTGNPQFRSAPLTFSPMRVRAGAILREGRRWFCSVPLELGGASWLASVLETPCASAATCAAYFYFDQGEHKLAGNTLFGALGSLLIVWAAALLTFLLSLDKAYLHTFYSIETGPQFTAGLFHHHLGNDRLRIDIFTYNERLFSSDLHADILSWAHASLASWTSSRPHGSRRPCKRPSRCGRSQACSTAPCLSRRNFHLEKRQRGARTDHRETHSVARKECLRTEYAQVHNTLTPLLCNSHVC